MLECALTEDQMFFISVASNLGGLAGAPWFESLRRISFSELVTASSADGPALCVVLFFARNEQGRMKNLCGSHHKRNFMENQIIPLILGRDRDGGRG